MLLLPRALREFLPTRPYFADRFLSPGRVAGC
jgi:hypothetical protein